MNVAKGDHEMGLPHGEYDGARGGFHDRQALCGRGDSGDRIRDRFCDGGLLLLRILRGHEGLFGESR